MNLTEVWFAGAHSDIGGGAVPNETPNDLARIPLRWMVRECFLNKTDILFHSSELNKIGLSPDTLWPVAKVPTLSEPKLADVNEKGSAYHEGRHPNKATDMKVVNSPLPSLSKLVPDEKVRLGTTEDEKDAVQPIHDRLSRNPMWWILEPFSTKERHDGTWWSWFSYVARFNSHSRFSPLTIPPRMNLGKPRVTHGQKGFPTYVHRSVLYRMQQKELKYKPRAALLEKPAPVWVD